MKFICRLNVMRRSYVYLAVGGGHPSRTASGCSMREEMRYVRRVGLVAMPGGAVVEFELSIGCPLIRSQQKGSGHSQIAGRLPKDIQNYPHRSRTNHSQATVGP